MNNHEYRAYKNRLAKAIEILNKEVSRLTALKDNKSIIYDNCDHKDGSGPWSRDTVVALQDEVYCTQCEAFPKKREVHRTICQCGNREIELGYKLCLECWKVEGDKLRPQEVSKDHLK